MQRRAIGSFAVARLTLDDVRFRFPGAEEDTLKGIDLVVGDGEAHALLGGSGAGKTTLLRLIAGLATPTAGQIAFDTEIVASPSQSQRPRERGVSFVFQFPVLYEGMSVAANLGFPLKNTRTLSSNDVERRVKEVADLVGLADLDRAPAALTLFERQLVAIGKAIIREDVAVVLLDEPLTAVETDAKWRMREVLKDLHRRAGVTMIYVTHDQTEALTFADAVSVMDDGRILQTGSVTELIDEPVHERVGSFIGSPGMNLLPADVLGGASGTIGFRPEWATIGDGPGTPVTLTASQATSTRNGKPFGIQIARIGEHLVKTVQTLDLDVQAPARLTIHRSITFVDGERVW